MVWLVYFVACPQNYKNHADGHCKALPVVPNNEHAAWQAAGAPNV